MKQLTCGEEGGKREGREEGREEERKEKGEEGKEYEKLFGVFSIPGVEFSTIMFPAYLHTFHKGCKQREFCGPSSVQKAVRVQ